MPTVKLNRKVFENLVGKRLPDDKLKERISYLGTDLESLDDDQINVEIFPNRPDLLSEQGFARAFSSFIGVKTGLREYKVNKSSPEFKIIVDKSVKRYRPYSAAAIVKGINFTDEFIKEIMQNQEKLHMTFGRNRKKVALGYYLLDKIKFPVTYKAEDPKKIKFKPLHFSRELTGLQILSQHPTGREYAYQLENLDRYPVYYDSNGKVLSMPPIINSDDSGNILPGTCDVLVECSGFDQRILNLAINMCVTALADAGGKIYSVDIVYPGNKKISLPNLAPSEMKIDIDYVNKRLGLDLKEKDIKTLLGRMGYDYAKGKAFVPAYRADILHPIDLVEDIAIAYGFENFKPCLPKIATVGEENKFIIFKRKVAEILVGLDLIECEIYHLTSKEHQTKMMEYNLPLIELANALNIEYSVLNAWLLPHIMEILKNNKHHEYPQNIFCTARVFKKGVSETGVVEVERLACSLCSDTADFTRIKQILDYLFRMLDLSYSIEEKEHDSFIPGRVGRILVNNKKVGYIGEISPKVIRNWELDMPIAAFEINLSGLYDILYEEHETPSVSKKK